MSRPQAGRARSALSDVHSIPDTSSKNTLAPGSWALDLVQSPFLIVRSTFLVLVATLSLTLLISATVHTCLAENIYHSIPPTSVVLMAGNCLVLMASVSLAVDILFYRIRMTRVDMECAGVGAMTLFQIPITINMTVKNPWIYCAADSEWSVCASSTLLVQIAWLSSMTGLTYFLLLLVMTLSHRHVYSNVWEQRVQDVEWFTVPQEEVPSLTIQSCDSLVTTDAAAVSTQKKQALKPPGAETATQIKKEMSQHQPWDPPIRRGVDYPFGEYRHSRSSSSSSLPLPQPARQAVHFIEPNPLTPRASFQEDESKRPPEVPVLRSVECLCGRTTGHHRLGR